MHRVSSEQLIGAQSAKRSAADFL